MVLARLASARFILAALAVACDLHSALATTPAFRGCGVDLRWKLHNGVPLRVEIASDLQQTMKVMGLEVFQQQTFTYRLRLEPLRATPEGGWILGMRFEDVKLRIDMGGNRLTMYGDAQASNPLSDFFDALKKEQLLLTMSPSGAIAKVDGMAAFLRRLGANQQGLIALFSDERLRQIVNEYFCDLPNDPVLAGDSWREVGPWEIPVLGKYTTMTQFTYRGEQDAEARFHVARFTKFDIGGQQNPALRLIRNDVKIAESDGWIHFDRTRGHMMRSERSERFAGRLVLDLGGTVTDVEIDQRQKTTVRVVDR